MSKKLPSRSFLARDGIGEISHSERKLMLRWPLQFARDILQNCQFCEFRCRVDRTNEEYGNCAVSDKSRISSEFLHFGEELELIPSHTIFFSGCNFRCVFCQNHDISTQPLAGIRIGENELAEIILRRNRQGARNVNLVGGDPIPNLHFIMSLVSRFDENFKYIPVVWNSNVYHTPEASQVLDYFVDVYLADFKYGNDDCARRLSGVNNYLEVVTRNLRHADAQADIMIRHLVLPNHLGCCSEPVLRWIKENLPNCYFNLMFQYRPCHLAYNYPEIARPLNGDEIRMATMLARKIGVEVH
ncbi:MAG: radical SAM protein [Actinobacteria bacterium]|nr:radical SAM protein [Actinomycetota bacterium]